jgi:hypothetical protein
MCGHPFGGWSDSPRSCNSAHSPIVHPSCSSSSHLSRLAEHVRFPSDDISVWSGEAQQVELFRSSRRRKSQHQRWMASAVAAAGKQQHVRRFGHPPRDRRTVRCHSDFAWCFADSRRRPAKSRSGGCRRSHQMAEASAHARRA